MSLVESMDLESRRCEQSIHDSRRLSAQFPEVVALLEQYRNAADHNFEFTTRAAPFQGAARYSELVARIDKCLAALKGHGT